ncbi:hypothetical protein TTRE_0000168401 [Trichuris trichiura]|uniref:Uncharacterized protein n=1 Tax=Trichuris trichiura TaxID=36087 RepID=A0A077Z095_TRITR|nr:hypothetical protein TTRE_0000168401 [Trichuris trichiura]
MDDELATSTEPDPQAIFQSILAEAGLSPEDDVEAESENETEMVQKLKEEDVGRVLLQLKCFAAEKCPKMLSAVAIAETALGAYVCSKRSTRLELIPFSASSVAPKKLMHNFTMLFLCISPFNRPPIDALQ